MSSLARWSLRHDYAKAFQKSYRQTRSFLSVSHPRHFSAGQYTRRIQHDDSSDSGINYFEQDAVPSPDGKGFRAVGAPRNVQNRIKQLEKELEALKSQSPFVGIEELEGDENQKVLAESLAELEDAAKLSVGNPASKRGAKRMRSTKCTFETERLEIDLRLPEEQAKSLRNLNIALRETAAEPHGIKWPRQLWQRYVSSKKEVTGLLQLLPGAAWKVLWDSQYNSKILSDVRSQHLWALVDDLVQAGQSLTPTQKLIRIEGRLAANHPHEAMSLWDEEYEELAEHADLSEAFLPLGVKLRVEVDQMSDASELAAKLAKDKPSVAVSCFLPLIEKHLHAGTAESIEKAVNAYFITRITLGDAISLEDFDRLTLCFLQNGQPDFAIGVFKDMVLAECKSTNEAVVLRRKARDVFDHFQSTSSDFVESSNERALKMLQFLPRQFQNKYFYASWLKRLIGLDELEAAQKVLELMHHRGVRPDAKHLNGIMSAWLRRGTSHGRDTALELGRGMIRARLDFVARRRADSGPIALPMDLQSESTSNFSPDQELPPATIETFSILLLYYVRSNMKTSTASLLQTLHLAELEPNVFFTNHVLLSHKRAGDAAAAWDLFCTTTKNGLRPDMDTFATLWDICKDHSEGHSPGRSQAFPSPRALFGHMSAWLAILPAKANAEARATVSSETFLQIIRCFSLARDLRGTLVALYAMRDHFGLYPDMRAARLIAMLVARIGAPRRSQRVRLHDGKLIRRRQSVKVREQASQVHFEQALHVLDVLKRERDAELEAMGLSSTLR